MASATFSGSASVYNRTDEREIRRLYMSGTRETDIPQGDGKAGVTVTRGFKSWFSTREAGLTVESTVAVSLTCGQSTEEIEDACGRAGELAEGLASGGMADLGFHLKEVPEEIRSGLSKQLTAGTKKEIEEPPRRSEKARPGTDKYAHLPRRR